MQTIYLNTFSQEKCKGVLKSSTLGRDNETKEVKSNIHIFT